MVINSNNKILAAPISSPSFTDITLKNDKVNIKQSVLINISELTSINLLIAVTSNIFLKCFSHQLFFIVNKK